MQEGRKKELVRKAVISDVPEICDIIERFSSKGVMLHRTISDIHDNLRDFFVYADEGEIIGACALHICSERMGEIRSLAVKEGHTRQGIGRLLVQACLDEARSLGLSSIFALTYQVEFFHRLNFRTISKEVLPHKIWGDCVRCAKFPNCDEIAVIIDLQ